MPTLSTSLRSISWAAYLACSWTWCIGMFLPILLLRDYGPRGFIVFAVPNVLGAAAMGFVLSREQSRRLVETHRALIDLFSLVTLAYHAFFLAWFEGTLAAPIAIIVGVASGYVLRGGWTGIATLVWVFSAGVLIVLAGSGHAPNFRPSEPLDLGVVSLAALAPTVAMGFLLCPYLDPTFHRAIERSACPRASFSIGFIALFLWMILLTTAYAGMFLLDDPFDRSRLVRAHVLVQAMLTMALHAERRAALSRSPSPIALGVVVIASFILGRALAESGVADARPSVAGPTMSAGEIGYRVFLSFYGLVFPAYAYLCMIPTRDGHAGIAGPTGRRKRNTWLGAVAIAAPMFWMGFIERRELFLVPGLGIILLARLALAGGAGLPRRGHASPDLSSPLPQEDAGVRS